MKTLSHLSRRRFLQGAGLAGAASVLPGLPAAARQTAQGPARNLIFLVVDGMGMGTLSLAHHWLDRHRSEPLHWTQLYGRPGIVRAMQDTASANSPVTDSAAAASAWGSGQRVNNRSINMAPDGSALTPLYHLAREAGKATGLVTTCRVTHATPAGFVANVPHRDLENTIADQYLEREVDVVLGGGRRHFRGAGSGEREKNLTAAFEAKGYRFAEDRASLRRAAGSARLLGLFAESHMPYRIDRENDSALAGIPDLPEMFAAALKSLSQHDAGFILQVEGGRVDHAAHANDPAALLREQLEFDQCIPLALDFLERHPDTLLIVTTDHGTGGAQLNGWGQDYLDSGPALDRVDRFSVSFEALAARLAAAGRFDADYLTSATGLPVSHSQAAAVREALNTDKEPLDRALPQIFADSLRDLTAVGWTSNNHTAELVEVLACGPGSQHLPPFIRNQQLFGLMTQALRLGQPATAS